MGYFPELFVFNGLTRFSLRMNRKRHTSPHETASQPLPPVLKNSNNARRSVKKKSIVLPSAPSLDRRAFAAGGNSPNNPFSRIPYKSLKSLAHAEITSP